MNILTKNGGYRGWLLICGSIAFLGLAGISCPFSVTFTISEPIATPIETVNSPPDARPSVTSAPSPLSSQVEITPDTAGEVFSAEEIPSELEEAPDFAALERYMVELINKDREANGLDPLEWDDLAASAGRLHAIEMARYNYLSHWNQAGRGPEIRYGLMGGMYTVQENVYSFYQRYDTGEALPVSEWDWREVVQDSQASFMESPGHRANILDPNHTHVGIGIAYNPEVGEFRLVQEFIKRYVEFIQPQMAPVLARPGQTLPIQFTLLDEISQVVINLAYQPFPSPMDLSELRETNTYTSPANVVDASPYLQPQSGDFHEQVQLPAGGEPGYYHIRIWGSLEREEDLVGVILVVVEP